MKLIVTTGGSGGHIYPAISLSKYFLNKGHSVLFVGAKDKMEESISKMENIEFVGLKITSRKKIFKLIFDLFNSTRKSIKIIKKYKPDFVISFGNYISIPVAIAATINRTPLILHEQNMVIGKANRFLGFLSKHIIASFPLQNYYSKKVKLLGNPRGSESIKNNEISSIKTDIDHKNILIFMGSLGSSSINQTLKDFIEKYKTKEKIIIVTGKKYYHDFVNNLSTNEHFLILPYIDKMIPLLKKCDLVICRAGATTLSELTCLGVPSILVPSPYVANNHQAINASFMEQKGASIVINEIYFNPNILSKTLDQVLNDNKLRMSMRLNALKLALWQTNEKIELLLEEIKNGK